MWGFYALLFICQILYIYIAAAEFNKAKSKVRKVLTLLAAGFIMSTTIVYGVYSIIMSFSLENFLYAIYGKASWCRSQNLYYGVLCNNSSWTVYWGINKTNPFGIGHVYVECMVGNTTKKIGYIPKYLYLIKLHCSYDNTTDEVRCIPTI